MANSNGMDEMKKQVKDIVNERIEKSNEILKEMPPPPPTPSPCVVNFPTLSSFCIELIDA